MEQSDSRIAKEIAAEIEKGLDRLGLLYRLFYRVKTPQSLVRKLANNPEKYSPDGKRIQDLYGFRITLYFHDDIVVAQHLLGSLFEKIDETVDAVGNSNFDATRCNFIYRLPNGSREQSMTLRNEDRVDDTFEMQYRTVLSEGWHEVEHDLRYKCTDDWVGHDDLGRALNGILASLETSDWGMSKLFEDLSFRHYKKQNWSGMLRTKFRLRASGSLDPRIENIFSDNAVAKRLFRLDRRGFLDSIVNSTLKIPINLNNIVYAANYLDLDCNEIHELTPAPLKTMFSENFK